MPSHLPLSTMPTSARRLALALLGSLAVCAMAGCQQSKARAPVPFESAPWQFGHAGGSKLTTAHYVIYTTIQDPVLVNALPDFVEAAYEHYTRLLPPRRPPTERMPVFLLATRTQWEAFTRRFTGPRAPEFLRVNNGGYSERGVSVIQYVRHAITFPLFAHEGFHQYVYHCVDARLPAWLNEGFAVCCEGQRWSDRDGAYRVQEFDPWFNPARRNALAEALSADRLHPLAHLLATHPGEVLDGSSEGVQAYYAQVWALMLFLREGDDGRHAAGYQRLLDALAGPGLEPQARAAHIWGQQRTFDFGTAVFRGFIDEDVEAVERAYRMFLHARFLGPH